MSDYISIMMIKTTKPLACLVDAMNQERIQDLKDQIIEWQKAKKKFTIKETLESIDCIIDHLQEQLKDESFVQFTC